MDFIDYFIGHGNIKDNCVTKKGVMQLQEKTKLPWGKLCGALGVSEEFFDLYSENVLVDEDISGKLLAIAEIYKMGSEIFGTDRFVKWMKNPQKEFSKLKPQDILERVSGIEIVKSILEDISKTD